MSVSVHFWCLNVTATAGMGSLGSFVKSVLRKSIDQPFPTFAIESQRVLFFRRV